jgi:hypothetical protein
MSLMDFVKSAGEKLFNIGSAKAATEAAAAEPSNADKAKAANDAAGEAITNYIKAQNLTVTGLLVTYDGAAATVTVYGVAADQATKEKVALCCGNVAGVAKVNDMMSVDRSEPEATYYTVVSGTLRGREQVHEDLRSQQADARASGQDLSGAGAAHPAGLSRAGWAPRFRRR